VRRSGSPDPPTQELYERLLGEVETLDPREVEDVMAQHRKVW